jgi:hypothetical protein
MSILTGGRQRTIRNQDKVGKKRGEVPDVSPPSGVERIHAQRYLRHLVATEMNVNHPDAYKHFIWKCREVFLNIERGMFQTIMECKRDSVDVPTDRCKATLEWTDKRSGRITASFPAGRGGRAGRGRPGGPATASRLSDCLGSVALQDHL